jgi:hypothetical protein
LPAVVFRDFGGRVGSQNGIDLAAVTVCGIVFIHSKIWLVPVKKRIKE